MKLGAIRLLSRLRFRQFFRQKNKGLVGKIIIVAYFWFLELLFFSCFRRKEARVSSRCCSRSSSWGPLSPTPSSSSSP